MAKEPMTNETDLSAAELASGQSFLRTMKKWGILPNVMCWIGRLVDNKIEKRLAIVTTLFDRMGPTELYSLLFKAYDAAATPAGIDPFDLEVMSPHSNLGDELFISLSADAIDHALSEPRRMHLGQAAMIILSPIGEYPIMVWPEGIYVSQQRFATAVTDLRRANLLRRNIRML